MKKIRKLTMIEKHHGKSSNHYWARHHQGLRLFQ